MNQLFRIFLFVFLPVCLFAQSQNIRGKVTDADSKIPLIGATVSLLDSVATIGSTTDERGNFVLENIVLGRHSIQVQYLGYEPVTLNELVLTSGKELFLNIPLKEKITTLNTIEIRATTQQHDPLNEMATLSARSMSMEELHRHPANFYDPARMAMNFAGVAQAGDDILNEISVRGNSPRGILWRLEGIEIPNPNHFSERGSSGGGINMLSTNVMATSDFFAGAFPAEYGNALSGVFDIKMRNGNFSKRETAVQLGALGFEASTEGPFQEGKESSYLLSYRYSTLGILEQVGIIPAGDGSPDFQDASFKIHLPTQKLGTFNLFGLGGSFVTKEDFQTFFRETGNEKDFGKTGIIGLSHLSFLSSKTWLKAVLAFTHADARYEDGTFSENNNDDLDLHYTEKFVDQSKRLSLTLNHKFNNRHVLRAGGVISLLSYRFKLREEEFKVRREDDIFYRDWLDTWVDLLDSEGDSESFQAFGQWKYHISSSLTLNTGLHYLYFNLNGEHSIEPRIGMKWQISPRHRLSMGVGLHSKLEALPIYFIERMDASGNSFLPNQQLPLQQAIHYVIGYQQELAPRLQFKLEAYYQTIDNMPIDAAPNSQRAIVNGNLFDVIFNIEQLNANGKGRNYGVDIGIERNFGKQYYFLLQGSLYKSEYQTTTKQWYQTQYSSNYNLVVVGGKEFSVGKKATKKKILGLNGRLLLNGGLRYTPLDLEASIAQQRSVREAEPFGKRLPYYMRLDLGVYFHISGRKLAQRIGLQVQNLTSRENIYSRDEFFDVDSQKIRVSDSFQTTILPILSYRIEF